MHLDIDFSPEVSVRLTQAAQSKGIEPARFVENLVAESLPPVAEESSPKLTAKNAAAIAYLRKRIADEATDDPEEMRKADAEVEELMQNLNRNRIESGERPLFP